MLIPRQVFPGGIVRWYRTRPEVRAHWSFAGGTGPRWMSDMIVKVCGITNERDAEEALAAGADWIGLNFVAGPRRIDWSAADRILAVLADRTRAVALISIRTTGWPSEMIGRLQSSGIERVQVYCEDFSAVIPRLIDSGLRPIAVQSVRGDNCLASADALLKSCGLRKPEYILLDASTPNQLGGTGTRANWEAIDRARQRGMLEAWPPFLLAGGLTAENVAEAIRCLRPFGVDISSGVESRPGVKDGSKVRAFAAAVRAYSVP